MEAPVISDALIRWLDEVFPEEIPMTESPVDYYRAQGRKVIINRLRIENRKQSK